MALNRAIAVAQNEGPERGLEEIHSISDRDRLNAYPFYSAALGELEFGVEGTKPRASTSAQRLPWRATPWNGVSSAKKFSARCRFRPLPFDVLIRRIEE